jgi:hypothetical protein
MQKVTAAVEMTMATREEPEEAAVVSTQQQQQIWWRTADPMATGRGECYGRNGDPGVHVGSDGLGGCPSAMSEAITGSAHDSSTSVPARAGNR